MGLNQLLTLKGFFIYMVESTNLDPRAAATVGPEMAVNSVQDAAADIFGIIAGITAVPGDVDMITLDLTDEDGDPNTPEAVDTDFRGSAYSAQSVLIDSTLGIKQKVYLQIC